MQLDFIIIIKVGNRASAATAFAYAGLCAVCANRFPATSMDSCTFMLHKMAITYSMA